MSLLKKQKEDLTEALRNYMSVNEMSQEVLADATGINVSYINSLYTGKLTIGATQIKDSYYMNVADFIGFPLTKTYWSHRDTPGFRAITTELMDAKGNGSMKMIIDNTGFGKTYAVNRFYKEFKKGTFRITVSPLHRLRDILADVSEAMGVVAQYGDIRQLKAIRSRVRTLKMTNGYKVIIIIDEAENLKLPALKMIKVLYDFLREYCSIVLIGTDELPANLEKLLLRNECGIPQFYRRFKAGISVIRRGDKDSEFAPFLEEVQDKGLRKLLLTLCDNIGELHDFLEPALRDADRLGEPLTEDFFKVLYKL